MLFIRINFSGYRDYLAPVFLEESMPFITGIFFLKPFPEKQEISLGHHI